MLKHAVKAMARPLWARLRFRIGAEIDRRTEHDRANARRIAEAMAIFNEQLAQLHSQIDAMRLGMEELTRLQNLSSGEVGRRLEELGAAHTAASELFESRVASMIQQRIYVPPLPLVGPQAPFMQYSTCSVADMAHPKFAEICGLIGRQPVYHRKLWEWVYIVHHLREAGMLTAGKRGLCFGVGRETLPAFFAKMGCDIRATDAPPDIGVSSGWANSPHYGAALEALSFPEIVPDDVLHARVSHGYCDMNAIDDDLTGFDFNWSSCCFEHLGSLEAGVQFVINCVEKTLKPGGIAVHTTEYNLSSDDDTVADGPTVIYRRKDIDGLVSRLRDRGHEVQSFTPAPHAHGLDFHVDAPPYIANPHLKLRLSGYAATSVGLVIRRSAEPRTNPG